MQKVEKCKGCQLCKITNSNKTVINKNDGAKFEQKYEHIYVGHMGDLMSEQCSKHKYDVKNRPTQNELATHCHKDHDLVKDLKCSF